MGIAKGFLRISQTALANGPHRVADSVFTRLNQLCPPTSASLDKNEFKLFQHINENIMDSESNVKQPASRGVEKEITFNMNIICDEKEITDRGKLLQKTFLEFIKNNKSI